MSERSLKQKTVSGMLWVGVQKFGTLGITFLSNIVLARLLTPSDYGMVGMLAIFIAISTSFIDGGFGSALIQKTDPTQKDYSTVFYWNIFLSVVLYVILYVCAPYIEYFYKDIKGLSKILRVQGLILIINAVTVVQFNQLRKGMMFKLLARINIITAIVSVISAIIMAFCGFGVWALVFQQIISGLSNNFLLWIFCRWHPTEKFSFKSLKELFGFGSFIMVSSLINTIGNNINGLIIGKFFSAVTLGYFSQAKKLEDVSSNSFVGVIEQVTYPMFVEVKNDYTKIRNILGKVTSGVLALTMPLLYTICIMAEPIIVFLFSDRWLPSVPILQIITFQGIFIVMQSCNYNVVAAIGKSRVLFNWTIIKRTTNIAMVLILMYLFGLKGLLIGIVFGSGFIALCNMYLLAKYIDYPFIMQIKSILPVIMLSTIPFVLIFIIQNYLLPTHHLFIICIYGCLYLLTYAICLCFTNLRSIINLRAQVFEIVHTIRRNDKIL